MRPTRTTLFAHALAPALLALAIAGPAIAKPLPKPKTAASAGPQALSASLTGMARAEYEAAKILYQDGDFANAIVKFQRAYELSKDARLFWNVAVCEKSLRHYTRVLKAVEQYRKDGGALLTDQDRDDAAQLVETVKGLVGTLKITVDEPGADVFVDDAKVGVSPLSDAITIDVGQRRIRVTKPGFKDFARTEQAPGATEIAVAVVLQKEVHQGRLSVEAGKSDAIAIDGKVVGAGHWEGVLGSGGHTLRVTAKGMTPYQSEVVILDDQTRKIPVALEAAKGGGVPTWGWITGSGVVATGLVIGGIFLFKPAAATSTAGTIQPGTVQLSFGAGGVRFVGAR